MIKQLNELFNKAKTHQGLKRYGKNTAWLMAEKVLRMFVGLFVGIWVARYLGPEQFGLLSYAQSFVFLFTAIATLGLDGIVVRELVKDESKRDVLLGTAFTLKLTGAVLILPLLWFGVQVTNNDDYTNLLVFIIASATIFQSFNVIDFYYQSTVMSKYVALANSFSLLLSSIIKVGLILNHASLISFAIMFLFEALLLSCGLLYFYSKEKQHGFLRWKFNVKLAKKMLLSSWPLILSGVMISIYSRIDQIMIQQFLNNDAVGQYAAAMTLSEAWYFIPVAIASSTMPALINAKNNVELYTSRLQKLYTIMIWLGIFVGLFATLFADWIVLLSYGNSYSEAVGSLKIQIWSGIFVSISIIKGRWQIIEGYEIYHWYGSILAVVFNIFFNLILIPLMGIAGAAVATLVTRIGGSFLINFFSPVLRSQNTYIYGAFLFKGFK